MISGEYWTYYVLPGFVVRTHDHQIEVKNYDNDEWEKQGDSKTRQLANIMTREGTLVSKDEANEVYSKFKLKVKKLT